MNIVFLGNCIFTSKIIDSLLNNKNLAITLVSYKDCPDYCVNRSLPRFRKHNNFKYIDFDINKDNELAIVAKGKYDLLLCCCWDRKLPEELLNLLPCFNFHASLLPKYRGATPLQAQLKNGEKFGGATIHLMTQNFDSGPIYKQSSFKISKREDLESIALKVSKRMCLLAKQFFDEYPEIELRPQNESEATFC